MKTSKKPPPDSVGNVLGRISALRMVAQQHAGVAVREGDDYGKALAKSMGARKTAFKELQQRLETARAANGSTAPEPKTKKKGLTASVAPQEPSKKKGGGTVPKDYDDLLATLGGL